MLRGVMTSLHKFKPGDVAPMTRDWNGRRIPSQHALVLQPINYEDYSRFLADGGYAAPPESHDDRRKFYEVSID